MLARLKESVNGLLDALNSDSDDDDDGSQQQQKQTRLSSTQHRRQQHVESGQDIVLSMNTGNASEGSELLASDSDDDRDEEESSSSSFLLKTMIFGDVDGGLGDKSAPLEEWRRRLPPQLRGDYYAALGAQYWCAEGELGEVRVQFAMEIYDRFRQYAPLGKVAHLQRPYTELDLLGLEYLLEDVGRQRFSSLSFSDICLNGEEPASAFPLNKGCLDTFVVCRTHDYLYGRLIEDALLSQADPRRLPRDTLEASQVHWQTRTRRFPLCTNPSCLPTRDHDRKACRHQWVVYTRTDSDFYRYCDTARLQNRYVDYDRHDGSSPNQLRISYHLVNFLCGPLLPQLASIDGVEQYDCWVMQSIELIDLWNTAVRVELNRNRTFASDEAPSGPLALLQQQVVQHQKQHQQECTTDASRTDHWHS